MNAVQLRLALAVVRAWTRFYTWRMTPDLRDARRAEIESDLWEFQRDDAANGGLSSAAHVVARLLAGVPDDLRWRVEQPARRERRLGRTAALATAGLVLGMLWVFFEMRPGELPPPPAPPALHWVAQRLAPPPPPPPPPPPRDPRSSSTDRVVGQRPPPPPH